MPTPETARFPPVTVIMPVRNEADFIARSLGAALSQDYPPELLEIIIADGMSTDDTRQIILSVCAQSPAVRVVVLDNPARIVPAGFNLALSQAQGEIIVRVDGHVIIEPDYVRECVLTLQRVDADNVGGRMDPVGSPGFGEAVALATTSPFGVGGGRFHYSNHEEWVDTVYLGAWRRELFERIGPFDEAFVRNQDDEFNYRLLSAGGKILLNPRIRSRYHNRGDPASLWRQYFQYGYWKVRVMQKHPRQMRLRQFAPPVLAALIVGGAATSLISPLVRALWLGLIGIYAAANLAASVWAARRSGWRTMLLLPLAFAILHFGYGLGFLTGLAAFADRWGQNNHERS